MKHFFKISNLPFVLIFLFLVIFKNNFAHADDKDVVLTCDTAYYDKCIDVGRTVNIIATIATKQETVTKLTSMYNLMIRNMPTGYRMTMGNGIALVISERDMPSQLPLAGNNQAFRDWLKSTIDHGWRGYTSNDTNPPFIMITEEMICRAGVPSRIPAETPALYRRFDQAVHEYAHYISGRLAASNIRNIDEELKQIYIKEGLFPNNGSFFSAEEFPWTVQTFFSSNGDRPDGKPNSAQDLKPSVRIFLESIFGPAPTQAELNLCN